MRKMMMAVAALALSSGVAWGQGVATQSVTLSANVNGYCSIDDSATGTVREATVTTENGKVKNPDTALSLSVGTSKVVCTGNAKIQLTTTSGGLTSGTTAPPNGYTNKIHYTATATYNGKTETLTTTDSTAAGTTTLGAITTAGPQTNMDLIIVVTPTATPANKALINGLYGDTLTITLTPNA